MRLGCCPVAYAHQEGSTAQLGVRLGPRCQGGISLPPEYFETPRSVAHHVSLSTGFPKQEYWEWVAIPFSRRNLPDPGIEAGSPALQADSAPYEPPGKPQQE